MNSSSTTQPFPQHPSYHELTDHPVFVLEVRMKLFGGANFSSPAAAGDPVLSVQMILWRNYVFLSAP
jgi:hypothetical protein